MTAYIVHEEDLFHNEAEIREIDLKFILDLVKDTDLSVLIEDGNMNEHNCDLFITISKELQDCTDRSYDKPQNHTESYFSMMQKEYGHLR